MTDRGHETDSRRVVRIVGRDADIEFPDPGAVGRVGGAEQDGGPVREVGVCGWREGVQGL